MRSMCAAAVALCIGLFLAYADDKKPAGGGGESRAERLKSIAAKYDKELTELKKRFEMARDPADQRGIREEAREATVLAIRDALKLIEEDPKDEVAFNAAVFAVEKGGRAGAAKEIDAVAGAVAEHHLNNPKVKELLPVFAGTGKGGEKFLEIAAEKASDKGVKAVALFYLGMAASRQLDDEDDAKKVDDLIAKAKGYFRKAEAESPDAKIGTTTVGKAVADQLEALRSLTAIAIGKTVPDTIEGTDLSDKKVKLSSYRGKVVLLDIWATWCGPCRSMIPHEREMVKKLAGKPFALVSVSCDEKQEDLVKFLETEKMPWEHWFDGAGGAVAKTFRIRAFPTLYLIDHAGVIRHKWVGVPRNEELEKAVHEAVEEAVKAKG